MTHRRVSGLMLQFPRTGMKVGTGVRELPRFSRDSGSVSPDPNRQPRNGRNADVPSPGDSRRNPADRGQVAGPTASGAPGGDGPDLSRVCARDNPNDRRHPNASFTCVTCERRFCRGDDGDCWNCQLLKMKCWACRKSAQEVSMHSCHDCEKNICNAYVSWA